MLVDVTTAQQLFEVLPAEQRWPTLSPAYVAADAVRNAVLQPLFLLARVDQGWLMHALHEAVINESNCCDWQSAYGYGGPLVHDLGRTALAQAWQALDGVALTRQVVAEFIRFHPVLGNQQSYPGTVRQDRQVVLIDLGVADLLMSYSGRARTAIRKALRDGLRADWEDPADACAVFPEFYRRSMREIGAGDFYQFGDDYFQAILALPGSRVLSVWQGNERLSMGLFLFGPCQVEYHLSGTSPQGRLLGATNLLLHTVACLAQAAGCRWLYLGGGSSTNADDPLLRFKSSFAGANHSFSFGYRIYDSLAYQHLRETRPVQAAASRRVLFYRE